MAAAAPEAVKLLHGTEKSAGVLAFLCLSLKEGGRAARGWCVRVCRRALVAWGRFKKKRLSASPWMHKLSVVGNREREALTKGRRGCPRRRVGSSRVAK